MDTNLLTYSEDLYTRLNSTLWKVRGGLWFNLWGSYFVPGTKIDQWNYWGGFCFVRSSWLCIKAETLRLFVLLSYAIETCGIQETFLANIFRQVSFKPPPPFFFAFSWFCVHFYLDFLDFSSNLFRFFFAKRPGKHNIVATRAY